MAILSAAGVRSFRRFVRDHYRRAGRARLPWRKTRDPYRIFVSEIMLQQTQVPRVLERYGPFIERFPDFQALARAPLREVLRQWSGLGYNRRALYLKRAAETIVREHGGRLPRGEAALRALPGVGAATAASILAFAFGEARPFIETNIRAVFIHRFFPGRRRVADGEILPLVERTMDVRDPRRLFWALLDCGAALKKAEENPSRRSAHHIRQGGFEGSNRQARGKILKALTERRMTEAALAKATGLPAEIIRRNLASLEREGLAARRGKSFTIE